jgi:vacuolar-type H+-ATPase subunit E/Vma4
MEAGKIKNLEGRRAALRLAIKAVLHADFESLDQKVKAFASKTYLYPEELGALIGIDRESGASDFKLFAKACEAKRARKEVPEKQERIYADILARIEKKLRSQGEKF